MTGFVLQQFSGIAPKISAKALSEDMAQIAQNCRLDRLAVESLNAPEEVAVTVPANSISAYPHASYGEGWRFSTSDDDVVGTLLPSDPRETIYITDDQYPKMRSTTDYRLGIPAPDAVLDVSGNAGSDPEPRFYVCTYVDHWGFEGPPSSPVLHSTTDGETANVTLPSFPAGEYNFGSNSVVRLYRTNTGSGSTIYQYVGEIGVGDAGWPVLVDNVTNALLQEELSTATWIGPPDDDASKYPDGPLQGLIELSNGSLCGFAGNTLYFSEPYVPYAWPASYRISGSEQIVSIAETQQGIVVGTNGTPWLVVGAHPEAMAKYDIAIKQACVSKRSMVDMGDYAIYAAPDGLVQLSGNDATLVTQAYFSQDEWQQYNPSTIRAFLYEGMYVGFYGDIADGTGFIFDPRSEKNAFVELSGLNIEYAYTDQSDGQAYVLYDDNGTRKLGTFNNGLPLNYTWRSKEFTAPKNIGPSVCRVEADTYPVTLTIYGENKQFDQITVYDDRPVRIRATSRYKQWSFQITGTSRVNYFGVWDSMAEVV